MNITPRLEHAIRTATVAHRKQSRKGSDLPYIIHPFSVMCIASSATDDEDVLIACLFHDILEDVPEEYPREKMLEEFGERVVSIVDGVTKDGLLPSWQDRADTYLHHLEHDDSDESVLVCLSDKIHNLMSILRDNEEYGEELWSRFNAGKEKQLWWYKEVLKITRQRLPDVKLNDDLEALVKQFNMVTYV